MDIQCKKERSNGMQRSTFLIIGPGELVARHIEVFIRI
jgi:hypothetical protein